MCDISDVSDMSDMSDISDIQARVTVSVCQTVSDMVTCQMSDMSDVTVFVCHV